MESAPESQPGEGGSADVEHVEGDVNVGGGEPSPAPDSDGGESAGDGGE